KSHRSRVALISFVTGFSFLTIHSFITFYAGRPLNTLRTRRPRGSRGSDDL
ncbi:hypothetical protein X975_00436, partial [Stegodyphus mimosarum]